MRRRSTALIALLLLAISVDADPRRRASGKPTSDPNTPEGWLIRNAYVLTSAERVPYLFDLEPLRSMVGDADVVGLGDGTHGTSEFFKVKIRVIEFLARELGFDLVAFEGPYPLMQRMNQYVLGGPGDARALVREMKPLFYVFWNCEEIVDFLEFMREYNATRGDRPPLQMAGFDIYEAYGASRAVIEYLRTVNPPAAALAEGQYSCIPQGSMVAIGGCRDAATSVYDAFVLREADYTAITGASAYRNALQHARVVLQSGEGTGPKRDDNMAENALWLRDHGSATRKVILWAHNAHLSRAPNLWAFNQPMGKTLAETLGSEYFMIATFTAAGAFRQWQPGGSQSITSTYPALKSTDFESYVRQRGLPRLLIPFRGAVPQWLANPIHYYTAGTSGVPGLTEVLPDHYDAGIFIDTTSPIQEIDN
jgi:erythromycin esterase